MQNYELRTKSFYYSRYYILINYNYNTCDETVVLLDELPKRQNTNIFVHNIIIYLLWPMSSIIMY